jgi:uracil-DNA glycosylase
VPCDLMLVGEGPGVEEDRYGRPWVGKAGRELWRYLWQACHLRREEVYATNLVKLRVPDDGDPTPDDIARDSKVLEEELENVNPEIIVTLGRWSTRRFISGADMEWCHGVPHWSSSDNRVIFPCVHPAAGLHSTEFQGTIAWDFEQLARLLRGEIEPGAATDEYPKPKYIETRSWVGAGDAAVDTEGSARKPWCISFSSTPGTGVCNRKGDASFRHIVLHNALHDIGVLRAFGTDYETFDDTMIKAYLLCVEPQGLKALAKRHCGMEMQSYDEVVGKANEEHAVRYLIQVSEWLSKQSRSESHESCPTRRKILRQIDGRGGKKLSRMSRKGSRLSSKL